MTEEDLLRQPAEAYMNEPQRQYFRNLLLGQRVELQERIEQDFQALRVQEVHSDPADLGSAEEERHWQLRTLEREKRLLDKIDQALERLAKGITAGVRKPASRSACAACCCVRPRPCA